MIRNLSEGDGRHLHAAAAYCEELRAVGYIPPGWRALSTAQPQDIADRLPGVLGIPAEGWQHDASSCIEKFFCDSSVLPRMSAGERALLRSQGGPLAALPYTVVPTCPLRRFDPDIFRVLLLRRLRLPLPPIFPLLPVWPSTRLPWPSPCKLFEGRCVGEAWFRFGVCSCTGVPRGRSESLDKHLRAGSGCCGSASGGPTTD